jgi:hypothetical protein
MSNVSHPKHYNSGNIEVIEYLEDQFMNRPHEWNAVKYLSRAGRKDSAKEIEDLEKAIWYINRKIELLKSAKEGNRPRRPNDMNPHPSTSVTDASTSVKPEPPKDTANPARWFTGTWRRENGRTFFELADNLQRSWVDKVVGRSMYLTEASVDSNTYTIPVVGAWYENADTQYFIPSQKLECLKPLYNKVITMRTSGKAL